MQALLHLCRQCSFKYSVMTRFYMLMLALLVSVNSIWAQETTSENTSDSKLPFSIKAYPFRGTYLDKGVHFDKFGGAYPAGVNLGFEFPSQQQHPWQQMQVQ